jgi:HK97 family phage portal protein
MSILSSLSAQLGKVARLFSTDKQYISRVFPFSSMPVYPDINSRTAIQKGYNYNIAIYSIVMKDARKFASIPRFVYDARKYEEKGGHRPAPPGVNKIIWEHKAYTPFEDKRPSATAPSLTELLNRPNEYLSQDLFFEAVRCYYKVCGEAMIWLNRGDLEGYRNEDGSFKNEVIDKLPVLEMYVLPVDMMTITPDPNNLWGILSYVLEIDRSIHIRKNDVIHWKTTNLNFNADTREHLRGFSPLIPGRKSLEMNNSMADSSVRMAQNDGARYVLFNEDKAQMNPTQQAQLQSVIDRKINNNDVKSAVATLQGKWGGIDLGKSAIDMELLKGKELSWKELCFLLTTPYEFFNDAITFANKETAQIGWITNDIEPATKQLDGEMNRMLLKAFNLEGKAFIGSDCSSLPEMKKVAVETAKLLKESGVVTKNEIRETMGYEKSSNPLMDEVWVTSGETPLSQITDDGKDEEELITQLESAYGKVGANGNGN